MHVWYAVPLVVKEGTHFRGDDTIGIYGLGAE
jgi:hypothetical protein